MNKAKLDLIIDKYNKDFETNWSEEAYKWKEINNFKENYLLF